MNQGTSKTDLIDFTGRHAVPGDMVDAIIRPDDLVTLISSYYRTAPESPNTTSTIHPPTLRTTFKAAICFCAYARISPTLSAWSSQDL